MVGPPDTYADPHPFLFDLAFVRCPTRQATTPLRRAAAAPRIRPGGLLLVDNTLWSGAVLDENDTSDETVVIKALNNRIAADPQ